MSFLLDCMPFVAHHTAPALMTAFQQMLGKWNIDVGRCHVVLRDNAANISKCFRDANIESLGCFAHTTQLCVHDGLLSKPAVSNIISIGKKLVGHFRHSSSATSRFKELQAELCLPDHQLIQDRRALTVYCSEVEGTSCPTAYQRSVAENTVCVLAPFEEATREVSFETAHISLVIPIVTALRNLLNKEGNDAGVKTMKSTLLKSLDERFEDIEKKPLYTVATLIDPRFKTKFFSSQATLTAAKAAVLLAFNKITVQKVSMQDGSQSEHAEQKIDKIEEVPAKQARMDNFSTSSLLWRCIDEIIQSTSVGGTVHEQQLPTGMDTQLSQYLAEPEIDRHADPLQWWSDNMQRLPALATESSLFGCPTDKCTIRTCVQCCWGGPQ
ncbi:zinc finger BED domain-containing protein 4-like [Hydra vulgaris]|uniref:zinc finger BED domain-containing protein 4-like n=1 Tax=Hydra vulgaris TaxID=6087 RepID=UPI0032EA7C9D